MEDVMRLQDLQRRVLDGEEVPAEEYWEVIEGLRQGRKSAAENSSGKSKTTVKEVDLDELFPGS
jgi:hypothetical protein